MLLETAIVIAAGAAQTGLIWYGVRQTLRSRIREKREDRRPVETAPAAGSSAEPSEDPSRKANLDGHECEAMSDRCGGTYGQTNDLEVPSDQTPPADGEPVETVNAADSLDLGETDPGIPSSDATEYTSSISGDTFQNSESLSTDTVQVNTSRAATPEPKPIHRQKLTNVEQPGDTEPKRPRSIGGRRDQESRNSISRKRGPSGNGSDSTTRPILVCRRSHDVWQWEMLLSAVEGCKIAMVQHDGEPLDMVNGECRLSSFSGRLSVAFKDREAVELLLFDGKPLIFKVQNDWTGDGRNISGITNGHFVVIAPKEWRRKGRAPVEPERCTDPEFVAHYFLLNGAMREADQYGFEECTISLFRSGFELKGQCVFDNSKEGRLFVGAGPELYPSQDVVWVRVGEEKESGWRGENFKPAEQTIADVLNGRQGHFFIRVYDDKLLDSGEFRYLRDLREIRVNDELYTETTLLAPPSAGHSPTEVQFVGTDGDMLPLKIEDAGTEGTYSKVLPNGSIIADPHPDGPDGDYLSCLLETDAGHVPLMVKLPRIWWRMEPSDSETGKWRDTPLTMTRQEFRRQADASRTIRLFLPPCIDSIKAGFDGELDRNYSSREQEDVVKIPLSDFVDYSQLDPRSNEDTSFNVQCNESVLTLISITASSEPAIDPVGIGKTDLLPDVVIEYSIGVIKAKIRTLREKKAEVQEDNRKEILRQKIRRLKRLTRKLSRKAKLQAPTADMEITGRLDDA